MGKFSDALEKYKQADNELSPKQPLEYQRREDEKNADDPPETIEKSQILNGTQYASDESAMDPNLFTYFKPMSYESEQFKVLRSSILFPPSGNPPRTILISSVLPREGKSFVATNLAVSLALNIDQHVLLIDCDIRKPSVHRIFGFGAVPGLSDYLTKTQELSPFFLKTKIEKLSILSAGTSSSNPAELLSSRAMMSLLEEVKTRYKDRTVIFDAPPPQIIADINPIARYVDGILMVVRSGYTPRNLIQNRIEILGKEKIIGVVFNGVNMSSIARRKYGGYKQYGKYKNAYEGQKD